MRGAASRILLVAALLLLAPFVAAQSPPAQRGVVLPLYAADPEFDYGPALEEIAALGANSVCLLVTLFQRDAAAVEIRPRAGRTIPDEPLRRTLAQARASGLDAMLLPIVLLEEAGPDDWRGNIRPSDPDAWWRSYGAAMRRYARIAGEEGAAWFSIGSELASMESHADAWRALAGAIRAESPGLRLLYSCNWDHLHGPEPWWDAIDAIGVSAYYELADGPGAPQWALDAAWVAERDALLAWRSRAGLSRLPIVFTEVGYPSIAGGAAWPWDYTRTAAVDLDEQRRAYDAFIRAWDGRPEAGGAYFFKWLSFEEDDLRSYSPRGKPAEWSIRSWYSVPAAADPASVAE